MMNGGQQIDPGLIQALAGVGENQPEQDKLALQAQMANQMRNGNPMPKNNDMAGKVVVRNNPLQYVGSALNQYVGAQKQNQVLTQMQSQAEQLRDVKGKFMSALAANQNPQNVHPSQQAVAGGNGGGAMQEIMNDADNSNMMDPGSN